MPSRRNGLLDRIQHLTPSWFAVVMGTGIIGILIDNLPYPGKRARDIVNLAFLITNASLFILFTAASIARYIIFPYTWSLMINESLQSLFIGCLPMALATLISAATSITQSFGHNGGGLMTFLWTMWWIDASLSVASAIIIPYIMITRHKHSLESHSAAWLLPVVPLIVNASAGGVMTGALLDTSRTKATITAAFSCVELATGLCLSIMIAAVYLLRLAAHGFPKAGLIVSVFLPLGPCGQGGYALLVLSKHFANLATLKLSDTDAELYGKITIAIATSGALTLWCIGLWFGLISLMGILERSFHSSIPFKVNIWGMIFPTGVYSLLTLQLGATLDLAIFRVLGAIFTGATTLLWLVIACKTVYLVIEGSIFHAPCLDDAPLNVAWEEPKIDISDDVTVNVLTANGTPYGTSTPNGVLTPNSILTPNGVLNTNDGLTPACIH